MVDMAHGVTNQCGSTQVRPNWRAELSELGKGCKLPSFELFLSQPNRLGITSSLMGWRQLKRHGCNFMLGGSFTLHPTVIPHLSNLWPSTQ